MKARLPAVLLLPLAMILLGYHVLFTMVVLPWHFITVICLSLASSTRAGRLSAAAITISGLLYYLNDFWVWRLLADQYADRTLVMVSTLLSGPTLALTLMLAHTWLQTRIASSSRNTHTGGAAPNDGDRGDAPVTPNGVNAEMPGLLNALARRYT